jgi:hypothetical protein
VALAPLVGGRLKVSAAPERGSPMRLSPGYWRPAGLPGSSARLQGVLTCALRATVSALNPLCKKSVPW